MSKKICYESREWITILIRFFIIIGIISAIGIFIINYVNIENYEQSINQLAPYFCQNQQYKIDYKFICKNETYNCNYTLNDIFEEFKKNYPNKTIYNLSAFFEITIQTPEETKSVNISDINIINKFLRICKYKAFFCEWQSIDKNFTIGRYFSDEKGWGIECWNIHPTLSIEEVLEVCEKIRQGNCESLKSQKFYWKDGEFK